MDIRYRPAREADLDEMADVFLEHVAGSRDDILPLYRHVLTTGHFRVAEADGRLLAIAGATVREKLWYLNAFWARKAHLGQHFGMPLLRAMHEMGRADGATVFYTWSSSNPAAMASYLKIGLLPGCTIYAFSGVPAALPSVGALRVAPLEAAVAERIERAVFGVYRPLEHAYHVEVAGLRACQLVRGAEAFGYFYAGNGRVGPAAWTVPEVAESLLAAACKIAGSSGQPVRLAVPGTNHATLRFALDRGLRIVNHNHFMASAPFSTLERYLPSGPSLF